MVYQSPTDHDLFLSQDVGSGQGLQGHLDIRHPLHALPVLLRRLKTVRMGRLVKDKCWRPKERKLMNNKERRTYVIEKIELDLIDYFTNCVLCARRLILKESDESIPAARRHMKV